VAESTAARVVESLSFGQKTEKRVRWESWSFTVVGEGRVEVINESYGFERDEHKYVVSVEERDGLFVPIECECPADEYDCKHKVAVAVVGGPVVLSAAMAFTSREEPPLRAAGALLSRAMKSRRRKSATAPT